LKGAGGCFCLKFEETFTAVGNISIKNIKVYAYHGCLGEETAIGSDYRVDLEVNVNLNKAAISDSLPDTVDYVHLNRIVKEEMIIKSKLLEHAAKRILDRVFKEVGKVKKVKISVSKINPPIGGDVEMVTVTLKSKRSRK